MKNLKALNTVKRSVAVMLCASSLLAFTSCKPDCMLDTEESKQSITQGSLCNGTEIPDTYICDLKEPPYLSNAELSGIKSGDLPEITDIRTYLDCGLNFSYQLNENLYPHKVYGNGPIQILDTFHFYSDENNKTIEKIQFLCSILMNLGCFPIIRVSLPFISYGGSSYLVNVFLIGVVLSVWRRNKILSSDAQEQSKTSEQRKRITFENQKLVIDFGTTSEQ